MMQHLDPFVPGAAIAAGTIGSASAIVAQSAITDGLDPTTGWAGGIIVGGVAVFGLWFRYWSKQEAERVAERRESDRLKDERIRKLEAELDEVRDKYEQLLKGER